MNILEKLEAGVTDSVARFSPWLSPIPTAYLTGRATVVHLSWPIGLGVVTGLVVEFLGLSAINTALDLYNYNRNRRKIDPRAPLWIAVTLSLIYFGAVTALTVLLDTFPDLSQLAPLVFPLLSMAGVSVLALRADHRRRLEKIVADRSERRASRHGATHGDNGATMARQLTRQERLDAICRINEARNGDGPMTAQQIVAEYGVSLRQAQRDVAAVAGTAQKWVAGSNGNDTIGDT